MSLALFTSAGENLLGNSPETRDYSILFPGNVNSFVTPIRRLAVNLLQGLNWIQAAFVFILEFDESLRDYSGRFQLRLSSGQIHIKNILISLDADVIMGGSFQNHGEMDSIMPETSTYASVFWLTMPLVLSSSL